MQIVHKFLHSTNGECRNDHTPAARRGFANHAAKLRTRIGNRRMIAIAVRRLHHHHIRLSRWLRIADDGESFATHVTAEHEAHGASILGALEHHRR